MCETIELMHGRSSCHLYIGKFHEDILEIKQFYFWGICLLYKNKRKEDHSLRIGSIYCRVKCRKFSASCHV